MAWASRKEGDRVGVVLVTEQVGEQGPTWRPGAGVVLPTSALASMWVLLSYLLCNLTDPYPVTLLSTGSGHFWAKPFFPCEYPHRSASTE